jgi:hypothetical protein
MEKPGNLVSRFLFLSSAGGRNSIKKLIIPGVISGSGKRWQVTSAGGLQQILLFKISYNIPIRLAQGINLS